MKRCSLLPNVFASAVLLASLCVGCGPAHSQNALANDRLPPAQAIAESIAPTWSPPNVLAKERDVYDGDLWQQRMNGYLDGLAAAPARGKVAAHWRTLVLLYPATDTDYRDTDKKIKHYTGRLRPDQVAHVVQTMRQFPAIVSRLSDGFCEMEMNLQVIDRPVQFSFVESTAEGDKFQRPNYPEDCRPEQQRFDPDNVYDCVVVIHNPGPLIQSLRGVGGARETQIVINVQYAEDRYWNPNDANQSLGDFVHEWIHGLDSYFMGRGYKSRSMHHIYHFPGIVYNRNWHAAMLQGKMMSLNETRYGYSRAVWMSGRIGAPLAGLLPVQLLSPLPGVVLPAGVSEHFAWNAAWSQTDATGYRFRLYAANNLKTPLLSRDTATPALTLPAATLPAGAYLWTVQNFNDAGELSPVGESFPLLIRAPAEVPGIALTALEKTSDLQKLKSSDPFPEVSVAASSVCGLRAVWMEVTYPDGRIQRLLLHKKSPNENEPVWTGLLALLFERAEKTPLHCTTRLIAIDQAGRSAALKGPDIELTAAPTDADAKPHVPITARPLNPLYLPEGSATKGLKATPLAEVPADGGPYPIYTLAGPGGWDELFWLEVISPDDTPQTTSDRAALEHWYLFNGMVYGQYWFPPNTSGHNRIWQLVFATRDKQGAIARTTPFAVTQPGK